MLIKLLPRREYVRAGAQCHLAFAPDETHAALRLATLKRLQFWVIRATVAAPPILPIQPAGVRLPIVLAAFGMDRKSIERRDPGSPSIALSPSSRRPAHNTWLAPEALV
jgi:hypothetical protein